MYDLEQTPILVWFTVGFGFEGFFFTQKPLGHGSGISLNSYCLRVSHTATLGLHEGGFGSQPITLSE